MSVSLSAPDTSLSSRSVSGVSLSFGSCLVKHLAGCTPLSLSLILPLSVRCVQRWPPDYRGMRMCMAELLGRAANM